MGAVAFGVLMELCQGWFTKDRSADVHDAIANSVGSAIAITAIWLFEKIKK
jgi:VanZ family protein